MVDDWVLEDDDEEDDQTEGSDRSQEDSRLMEKFLQTRTILVSEAITDAAAQWTQRQSNGTQRVTA